MSSLKLSPVPHRIQFRNKRDYGNNGDFSLPFNPIPGMPELTGLMKLSGTGMNKIENLSQVMDSGKQKGQKGKQKGQKRRVARVKKRVFFLSKADSHTIRSIYFSCCHDLLSKRSITWTPEADNPVFSVFSGIAIFRLRNRSKHFVIKGLYKRLRLHVCCKICTRN